MKLPESFRFLPIYAMGFFCLSIQPMAGLVIPLWVLSLDASPLLIGLSVSAGAILPTFFCITSGAIIDRFGSKAVLRVSSLTIAVMVMLYPVFPSVAVVIAIQLLFGLIQSMSWVSSQTYVARLSKQTGNTAYAGYFSFAVNLGMFIGPLIVGLAWDYIAPWAAFTSVGAWAFCLWLSSLMLPVEKRVEDDGAPTTFSLSSLLPRWEYYQRAFSLFAIPAVVVVIYGTFMRLSASSIKSSFYLVYLEQIEFSALAIATLMSAYSFAGTVSALAVNVLTRFLQSEALLFAALAISILPLAITPLFTGYVSQLAVILISGFGIGMTLPLLISVLGRAVSSKEQGIAVGLRTSANYLASFVIPLVFGVWVQTVGLASSFYIIGAMLLLPMLYFVPLVLRNLGKSESQAVGK